MLLSFLNYSWTESFACMNRLYFYSFFCEWNFKQEMVFSSMSCIEYLLWDNVILYEYEKDIETSFFLKEFCTFRKYVCQSPPIIYKINSNLVNLRIGRQIVWLMISKGQKLGQFPEFSEIWNYTTLELLFSVFIYNV